MYLICLNLLAAVLMDTSMVDPLAVGGWLLSGVPPELALTNVCSNGHEGI